MPKTGHIALAGAPNVGKSSLLNTLVGQHLAIVSPRAQATRLPVTGIRTDADAQYVFHDLPGLLDPPTSCRCACADSPSIARPHGRRPASAPCARRAGASFERLAGLDHPIDAPVLTVYTKGDLVSADRRRASSTTPWWSPPLDHRLDDLPPLLRVRDRLPVARVRL